MLIPIFFLKMELILKYADETVKISATIGLSSSYYLKAKKVCRIAIEGSGEVFYLTEPGTLDSILSFD